MPTLKSQPLTVIVLAAGKGTRMQSALPKVLHPIAHAPMLGHVLRAAAPLKPAKTCVVVGPDMPEVEATAKQFATGKCVIAQQTEQLGTGHAVQCAVKKLGDLSGHLVLILYGDTPLLSTPTMQKLIEGIHAHNAVVGVLGMQQDNAGAYGRLITVGDSLERIVEAKEATPEELAVTFANSGIMAVQGGVLKNLLDKLTNHNAKGEYYLTDIVAHARAEHRPCIALEGDAAELSGVNSRIELSAAEQVFQARKRREMMEHGVSLLAPDTVFFAYDTELAAHSIIHPYVVFGVGVKIGSSTEVFPFSHLEGAQVDEKAKIGPFARLRPGSQIGRGVRIGNFVEIKKATLDVGAKVNHLSYIGDAFIGSNANIGAGTITCNYDGFNKHFTHVGAGTFVGSNSALVAPLEIGEGAIIAAGSVVTDDVEAESLAIARAPQKGKSGWARLFRHQRNN